jgi:DNA primase
MISKETVALVKERTDIVAVVSESVPSLKRFGRTFKACCPFHKEKTPSFHVNPERGWFHCFGCGEKGGAIDFLMKHDGYTFPEAVRALAERAGIAVEEDRGAAPSVDRAEAERQKKQKDDLYAVSQVAATFFEEQLRTHPQREYAEAELARRGLSVGDAAVQSFRIGYAPHAWDGLATYLRANGISPLAGEAVGLLVPRSSGSGHYDRFRHRLMFAVIDPQGRVVAFSGRALKDLPETEPSAEKKDPPPKYINSPESPIYTKGNMLFGLYQARQAIRTAESAILVEGNFDVVSLHARGVDTAVAPLGTAFTADQARLLKRYTPDVTILFDGDAAGRKATRLARGPCREAGLTAKVARIPDGTDPDELARTRGVDALRDVLAQTKGFEEHMMDELLDESFAQADATERMARVNEVLKLIADANDPLARMLWKSYADKLCARLDLHGKRYMHDDLAHSEPLRALERATKLAFQAQGHATAVPNGPKPQEARVRAGNPGAKERGEIVGAFIEYPALLDDPAAQEALELLEGPSVQTVGALRRSLVTGSGEEKTVDAAVFLDLVPAMIQAFASQRLAAPHHETLENARGSLIDNTAKLRKLILGREAEDIAREQYKQAGDWQAETELAREALERVRRKHGVKSEDARTGQGAPARDVGFERLESRPGRGTRNGHDGDEEP